VVGDWEALDGLKNFLIALDPRDANRLMGICLLARPLALGAAQVMENWFVGSFVSHYSCRTFDQPGAGVSPQPDGNPQ
jgi:hypothetical protein